MEAGWEVSGYVLAGGRSSRMGREKALLELGGKSLIQHAVTKLRRVCREVAILSSNPALARYAPLVQDVHPGCGPLSGIEAALWVSKFEWNLFLPVDVPFLPTAYLRAWIEGLPAAEERGVKVWIFTVEGRAQPTLALIHRQVRPFLTDALDGGQYKLLPVLERAAAELGSRDAVNPGAEMLKIPYWADLEARLSPERTGEDWEHATQAQREASQFWFANLNTPEEFAEAERHIHTLDT